MISIIIPHFNRSALLKEAITSVYSQTMPDWELIIVDDGSNIEELEAVRKLCDLDKRVRLCVRRSVHKGPSSCRNEGTEYSNYPYLIFLDSDDLLKPFCLTQRLKFMVENPGINMGVFLQESFNQVPGDLNVIFNIDIKHEKLIGAFLQNHNPWQTMAPIWSKEFFLKLGGFDESLLYMEDPELHLRALVTNGAGIKTCYSNPADCFYRINFQDNSKQRFYYNSILYRIIFYRKILQGYQDNRFIQQYRQDIRTGIYNLVRTFLYSRMKEFPELYQQFKTLIKSSPVFYTYEAARLCFLMEVGNSTGHVARMLKLKGVCYRLLPQ